MPNDLAQPPLIVERPLPAPDASWAAIAALYRADETKVVERLLVVTSRLEPCLPQRA